MTKRILVVPDIHGNSFWKEPVRKYLDTVDRVVFLGDYLDPYPDEHEDIQPQQVYDNLMDIVELKHEHMEKVVLLKGNHDQHYVSEIFRDLACGSRCDTTNWSIYNTVFIRNMELFKLVHREVVKGVPYIFSHAGLTLYWLHKVNAELWKLADNKVSLTDPQIIERINELDMTVEGLEMLAVIGKHRSLLGGKAGSVLWADIEEHAIKKSPKAYGLNKVFQVFGHTRLIDEYDMVEFDNFVLTDSSQCFMIDESREERIVALKDYTEEQ